MRTLIPSLITVLLLAFNTASAAAQPQEELATTVEAVLDILYQEDLSMEEKQRALKETIRQRFSFAVIARRAMGRNWNLLKDEQQEPFVALFTDLLIQSYTSGFEGGSRPEIEWTGQETLKEGYIVIRSSVSMDGSTFPVDYRLLQLRGDWQVYDILVEGVSLVGNYRKQFSSLLQRGTVEEMMDQLREKVGKST